MLLDDQKALDLFLLISTRAAKWRGKRKYKENEVLLSNKGVQYTQEKASFFEESGGEKYFTGRRSPWLPFHLVTQWFSSAPRVALTRVAIPFLPGRAWIHPPVSSQPCAPALLLLLPPPRVWMLRQQGCHPHHDLTHTFIFSLLMNSADISIQKTPKNELQPRGSSDFFLESGGLDLHLPWSWATASLEPVSQFSRGLCCSCFPLIFPISHQLCCTSNVQNILCMYVASYSSK